MLRAGSHPDRGADRLSVLPLQRESAATHFSRLRGLLLNSARVLCVSVVQLISHHQESNSRRLARVERSSLSATPHQHRLKAKVKLVPACINRSKTLHVFTAVLTFHLQRNYLSICS